MKNKWNIVLSIALAISLAVHFVPTPSVTASGTSEMFYAYDAESIHEKIGGDLTDAGLESLVYLVVMKNPNYVKNAPNSGEWYIVKVRENPVWRK
jgi:hypothetical protein